VLDQYPDKIKLIVKHFPLSGHMFAMKAAQAALAANRQNKFWEFRRKLFENHQSIDDAKIQEIAKCLGLDMEKFEKDMSSQSIKNIITRDIINGKKIGVHGTPTIFINGKRMKNNNLFLLFNIIDAEIKRNG
jgi:protein-disulfide isomerase